MSGTDTGWVALPRLRAARRQTLAGALAASLLGHALLLGWPLPLSTGADAGSAGLARSTLRVSLDLIAAANANPARAGSPLIAAAAPPAPGGEPEQSKDAPPGREATRGAVPLYGYYPAGRLSRMPQGIGIFDIQPPAGGDTGIGGKITLRVWISAAGAIDSLRVFASGLPAAYEQAALAAFEKMDFAPGEIDGVPVPSWVDVVIEYADFRREAAQAPAAE